MRIAFLRPVIVLAVAVAAATSALAALPTASELFFDKPYLALLQPGTRISYAYKHTTADAKLGESFDETLDLTISAVPEDPAKRVSDIDIRRGDNKTEAGPFPVMTGNPVVLVLLEREAKEIAALTKGSPFYIRNRMRDGLAGGTVEEARFDYDGRSVTGWKLVMTPFANDPNKVQLLEIAQRRYEFLFSDEVPGGLYAVNVTTPKADGSANMIETRLTLAGSNAPAAAK
ncbi:hypothetical protein [Bosea sp. 117]|uniref:hypothetical protein n=1 Tax=Bosea sp. 117 TaxID=1125973 RepID=UPI00068DAC60|nr:hypothetical protein [Bosea sp. 117]